MKYWHPIVARLTGNLELAMSFFFTSFIVLSSAIQPAFPSFSKLKTIAVENDAIQMKFNISNHSIAWTALIDRRTGFDLIGGGSTLFRIDYIDANGAALSANNTSMWDQVNIVKHPTSVELQFDSETYGVVRIVAELQNDQVEWEMSVRKTAASHQVSNVSFPLVEVAPLYNDATDDYAFYPEHFGRLVQNVLNSNHTDAGGNCFAGEYPSGRVNLSIMGVYDDHTGIYFSDAAASLAPRTLAVTPIHYSSHSRLLFQNSWPATFRASGKQIMKILHGDWFDASQSYKEQMKALRPDRFSRIIDSRVLDVGFWVAEACGPQDSGCMDRIKTFGSELELPMIFHWYNWHQIPFDDNYPAFLPARVGFSNAVRDLKLHGIDVMPYLNANLWDTSRLDFDPLDAVINSQGRYNYFVPTTLAQICPSSRRFRAVIADIASKLIDNHSAEGIYLDQVSAITPVKCNNPAHQHDTDAPTWWLDRGLYQMVASVEVSTQNSAFVTSEWANEAFVGKVDGLLVNNFVRESPIPLFNAVYNEAIRTFGRFQWQGIDMERAYRMKIGQSLTFGSQLGWLDSRLLENDSIRDLSIGLAKLRHLYKDQFNGRMLRPPELRGQTGLVSADWNHYWKPAPLTMPAVLSASFTSNGLDAISVIVNIGDSQKFVRCANSATATNVGRILRLEKETSQEIELASGQAMVFERHLEFCEVR